MDLALATARNMGVQLVLISEPNKTVLKKHKEWVYDENLDTCIVIMDKDIIIKTWGRGTGFSFIVTEYYNAFSCYSSGNQDIESMEALLDELGVHIRTNGVKNIISSDFNAKSPLWGEKRKDKRGELMAEWIAQNNLIILNDGISAYFLSGKLHIHNRPNSNQRTFWQQL